MKIKKDENLIQKLLNKMKKNSINNEIKKLEKIKKKIKAIKTIEELEAMEIELEELGILDRVKIERLKKKKKKKLEMQSFDDRIKCDAETINRMIEIKKNYKRKQAIKQQEELIQAREERQRNNGIKDKEKDRGERTRSSGGRERSR